MPGMIPTPYNVNGGPIYNGGPPSLYGSYADSYPKANGVGFSFKKRMERIDWRKVAATDIDRIAREMDFKSLQDNIMNITFCNIEAELDVRTMDPNFLKLFKLAQLTIEYLLHSQDYLTGSMAGMQDKLRKALKDHEETKTSVDKLKQELADVKKESHKRKKLLAAQQQILHSGANSYHKCPYCVKAFINASFLQAHLTRRHPEFISPQQTPSPVNAAANQVLEKELQEFKERLRMTESQLMEERNRLNQLTQMSGGNVHISVRKSWEAAKEAEMDKWKAEHLEKQMVPNERKIWEDDNRKEMEVWKNSQLEVQKKEIEQVRDMFMKEFNELNEKFQASERQLSDFQRRHGPKSNLGELKDDVDDGELVKQREEVAMLKEMLANRLSSVETSINSQVKKEIGNMQRQQADELNRLKAQLKDEKKSSGEQPKFEERIEELLIESSREQNHLLESQPFDFPDAGDEVVTFDVATMSKRQEEKIKQQGQKIEQIKQQEEKIEQIVSVPAASASPLKKRFSSPQHEPPAKKQKDVPKTRVEPPTDEEESELEMKEEMAQWTNQALDMEGMYGHSTLDSSGIRTGEFGTSDDLVGTLVRSARLQAHLRKDPSILKGMKEELEQLLTEQLEERGIPADSTGISNVVLNNKLDLLQKERQQIAKKYKNFWDIRRQFEKKVDKMAWERYIDSRKSPKAGSNRGSKRSLLSVSPKSSPYSGRKSPSTSKKSPKSPRKSPQVVKKSPVAAKKSPTVPRRSPSPPKPAPRVSTTLSTTASSTMRSEEDWDTEEEEEEEEMTEDDDYTDSAIDRVVKTTASSNMATPERSPAKKPAQNLPRNIEKEESDWDSEISELSNIIPSGDVKMRERPASVPTPVKKGPNVDRLSQSIELQLSGRSGSKPTGAVDMMKSGRKPSPQPTKKSNVPMDDDEDSVSFSISSLQDLAQPKPAPRKAAVRGSGETDFSTNTYGTSVWGSSRANNPAAKSSVSVTDWDSDLEVDDI